jgi:hypothetical protein
MGIRIARAPDQLKPSDRSSFSRFNYRHYPRVWREILLRHSFYLVERYGFIARVFGVGVGMAEAVESIEGRGSGETAEVLPRDLPWSRRLECWHARGNPTARQGVLMKRGLSSLLKLLAHNSWPPGSLVAQSRLEVGAPACGNPV